MKSKTAYILTLVIAWAAFVILSMAVMVPDSTADTPPAKSNTKPVQIIKAETGGAIKPNEKPVVGSNLLYYFDPARNTFYRYQLRDSVRVDTIPVHVVIRDTIRLDTTIVRVTYRDVDSLRVNIRDTTVVVTHQVDRYDTTWYVQVDSFFTLANAQNFEFVAIPPKIWTGQGDTLGVLMRVTTWSDSAGSRGRNYVLRGLGDIETFPVDSIGPPNSLGMFIRTQGVSPNTWRPFDSWTWQEVQRYWRRVHYPAKPVAPVQ